MAVLAGVGKFYWAGFPCCHYCSVCSSHTFPRNKPHCFKCCLRCLTSLLSMAGCDPSRKAQQFCWKEPWHRAFPAETWSASHHGPSALNAAVRNAEMMDGPAIASPCFDFLPALEECQPLPRVLSCHRALRISYCWLWHSSCRCASLLCCRSSRPLNP